MKTPKAQPAKKTAKQKLDEGAEKIRKAQAAAKPKKPKSVPGDTSEIIPPIAENTEDIGQILATCVTVNEAHSGVELSSTTSPGEYLRIFDYFAHQAAFAPFVLGDVINSAEAVFGKKYAVAMASTGRSIETLKQYALAARHIPAELRTLHPALTYSHIREVVKVPKLEDKKAILECAAASAEKGRPMSRQEIRKKADKFKPRKPKAVKKDEPAHEMSAVETADYNALLVDAGELLPRDTAFFLLLSFAEKKALLAVLTPIANLVTKLEKSLA